MMVGHWVEHSVVMMVVLMVGKMADLLVEMTAGKKDGR
jgi:hypothetical protein